MAQIAKDNYPLLLGTGEVTQDEYIQLFWNQRKYVKTIKLDLRRNIGMTHSALGIHKCQEFITQQVIQTPCPCCFDTHIIPDDDDEVSLQPPDPIQTNIQDMFKYTIKVRKNQIVTAGRLVTVLDMRPQPRGTRTNNNDSKVCSAIYK